MIGKGNFAKVYSATHKQTNKLVAIKAFEKNKFVDVNIDKVERAKLGWREDFKCDMMWGIALLYCLIKACSH